MRAAVVQTSNNTVANVILADASVDVPPYGCFLVDLDNDPCEIGWTYDPVTGVFTDPSAGSP